MTEFDEHYRSIYGERWTELRDALERRARSVALVSPFVDGRPEELLESARPHSTLSGCMEMPRGSEFPAPSAGTSGLKPYYLLDAASVAAARALELSEGDRVLDMCAAPGGKTLVAAFELGASGMLVANDRSTRRLARLREVVDNHLPERVRRHVAVRSRDGRKWGTRQTDAFDAVLVDAPCSGERHLLRDPVRLKEWSPSRSDHLAQRQFALLCAAVDVVRPGGRIVYATCALDPRENDEVIGKLLESRSERTEAETCELSFGESTRFGWRILPDEAGWGPMYVARLRCTESE